MEKNPALDADIKRKGNEMTTHRTPGSKILITLEGNNRIVYSPVKDQTSIEQDHSGIWFRMPGGGFSLNGYESPFKPDDTIVLQEEWRVHKAHDGLLDNLVSVAMGGDWEGCFTLKPMKSRAEDFWGKARPPSSMPPELDSKCVRFTVVKCLGVELLNIDPLSPNDDWHWKLLSKGKANDQIKHLGQDIGLAPN